jgi:hypothetical protein
MLESIIRSDDWFMEVLGTVRQAGIPDAWVGAGVVRDLVWSGPEFRPADVRDVDVAFFDPADLSRAGDERVTARLTGLDPRVPWEATNQAAVHTWYPAFFGTGPVDPLTSIADGVTTWPETATAVAVRLAKTGELEICAPLGLDDLLNGVWRHNPRRCSRETSLARLARHNPAERWPTVTVVPPG